jgi:hypothetical protein
MVKDSGASAAADAPLNRTHRDQNVQITGTP